MQQVEDAVIGAIATTARGVAFIVLGRFVRCAGLDELKDASNIDRRHATHGTQGAVAIGVIDEAGDDAAADGGEAVLVGKRGNSPANVAIDLVANSVVAVTQVVGVRANGAVGRTGAVREKSLCILLL